MLDISDVSYWLPSVKGSLNCTWNTWMPPLSWLGREVMAPHLWSAARVLLWVRLKTKGIGGYRIYRKEHASFIAFFLASICIDLHTQGHLNLRCQGSRTLAYSKQVTNSRNSTRQKKISLLFPSSATWFILAHKLIQYKAWKYQPRKIKSSTF